MNTIDAPTDAALVEATLAGDRAAFGKIVERYQRLLCSVAYSSIGQLSQSEDLAQEAFVEAWRRLPTLREPQKLRSWLCGILRFKVSRFRRETRHEPVDQADNLDSALEIPADVEPAGDAAMQKEEQALLWTALEQVPEAYREPLILYYREHKSVEHVAAALDLSEDNVKQRLVRGRKILQERVLAFVEGALERSTPGRVFTISVLAALPELTTSTKAAAIGAAAAHGGAIAKSVSVVTLLAAISSVVSTTLSLRAGLDQARTPTERRMVVKITLTLVGSVIAAIVALSYLRVAAYRWWDHRLTFALIAQAGGLISGAILPFVILRVLRGMRRLRTLQRKTHPQLFCSEVDRVGSPAGEYKSKFHLLGLPFVRVRLASPDEHEGPVVAWIAGGDRAYGLLLAWGAGAVAPISAGVVSVGIFTMGTISFGLVSIGAIAFGLIALGTMAYGFSAGSWISAMGWHSAQSGGFAIAKLAAQGPVAFAQHANDPVAQQLLTDPNAERNGMIFLLIITLVSVIPIACYAHAVRKRFGKAARAAALAAKAR